MYNTILCELYFFITNAVEDEERFFIFTFDKFSNPNISNLFIIKAIGLKVWCFLQFYDLYYFVVSSI